MAAGWQNGDPSLAHLIVKKQQLEVVGTRCCVFGAEEQFRPIRTQIGRAEPIGRRFGADSCPTCWNVAKGQIEKAYCKFFAITALKEAPASDHFFQDLKKNLSQYRDNRDTVLDIYDTIQAQVADTKYKKDFAKNEAQIDSDYDKLEEATRRVIAAHHDAVTAMMSPAAPTSGGASAPQPPPPWKLLTSFQPKIPLKLTSTIQDFHCWLREFQSYYDMSNLQQADMAIQRTVLQNCLHQDFQTKITEALSGVTDIKGGLTLVEQEFNKRHPQIIRRHQLFCLDQMPDEFVFEQRPS